MIIGTFEENSKIFVNVVQTIGFPECLGSGGSVPKGFAENNENFKNNEVYNVDRIEEGEAVQYLERGLKVGADDEQGMYTECRIYFQITGPEDLTKYIYSKEEDRQHLYVTYRIPVKLYNAMEIITIQRKNPVNQVLKKSKERVIKLKNEIKELESIRFNLSNTEDSDFVKNNINALVNAKKKEYVNASKEIYGLD